MAILKQRMLSCLNLVWTVSVFVTAISYAVRADENANPDFFTSNNKVDCINKMVEWCDNMQYPKEGAGMSMVSIALTDNSGRFWRIFCSSDSDGTNCTRNKSPWFSCSNDNKLNYDGVLLTKDSTENVDDEICNATKMAFNDIFIQNLSYNPKNVSTELNKDFEHFFQVLADLEEKMDILRSRVFSDCFPFCNKNPFYPPLDFNPPVDVYPPEPDSGETFTDFPDSSIDSTDSNNQLERE